MLMLELELELELELASRRHIFWDVSVQRICAHAEAAQ
jgi:hypothetical protein